MSKIAAEKYDASKELSLIKLSIPDPLMAEAYKELLRDLERHDLGICDDRKTAIRIKGSDIKVKMYIASNMIQTKTGKLARLSKDE